MKPISKWIPFAQLIVVLLSGTAIKMFYSAASVNDLLWVLAPTKLLVELWTGVHFSFESYSGYMSQDHSFLIAASCSGVNFLITAFLMLAIGKLWRGRSHRVGWGFIPVSFVCAYLTTIVANTVRISTTLYIRRQDPQLIWLNPEELHRFEGIVIYFGFLLLLFILSERMTGDNVRATGAFGPLRRSLLPLAIYYGTTLGVPLANGAFHRGSAASGFWLHALFVLFTPMILLLPLAITSFLKYQRSRDGVRKLENSAAVEI